MKRLVVPEGGEPYEEEIPAEEAVPQWVPAAPTQVTMRQARLALLAAGLLDDVEGWMTSADRAVQIEWEYATVVERKSLLVVGLASVLGLTDEQVDVLFVDAAAR